jgi:hypothetical protein
MTSINLILGKCRYLQLFPIYRCLKLYFKFCFSLCKLIFIYLFLCSGSDAPVCSPLLRWLGFFSRKCPSLCWKLLCASFTIPKICTKWNGTLAGMYVCILKMNVLTYTTAVYVIYVLYSMYVSMNDNLYVIINIKYYRMYSIYLHKILDLQCLYEFTACMLFK